MGKEPPRVGGGVMELVWMLWRREKSLAPLENQVLYHTVHSLVLTLPLSD